ncbi:MAG: hypothetical protein K9I29_03515 [Bacteroidales bacterium]|nr:hypothetical protein [Bacteroidales bacterium]MCF8327340.1 hypothetical protein [Bacteroidales bacterium]
MAAKKRKPGRKKFRKVSFKVSAKERELIEQCSKLDNTTVNKFIKAAIREKTSQYQKQIEEQNKNRVSENQLTLFKDRKVGDQISIFDIDLF